ncbi:hypothetical protein HUJ05_011026 [Dendroctonus ponderosae]|nr:hypothetical protein HUJ05_011026 [Dendroctonus ponderosae]
MVDDLALTDWSCSPEASRSLVINWNNLRVAHSPFYPTPPFWAPDDVIAKATRSMGHGQGCQVRKSSRCAERTRLLGNSTKEKNNSENVPDVRLRLFRFSRTHVILSAGFVAMDRSMYGKMVPGTRNPFECTMKHGTAAPGCT